MSHLIIYIVNDNYKKGKTRGFFHRFNYPRTIQKGSYESA